MYIVMVAFSVLIQHTRNDLSKKTHITTWYSCYDNLYNTYHYSYTNMSNFNISRFNCLKISSS